MVPLLFYLFAALALASALLVIFLREPVRALLALVAMMFALAVIFISLGAPFLAMIHLIVYAGAILVLFLFVILMQGLGAKDIPARQRFPKPYLGWAAFVGTAFFGTWALTGGRIQLGEAALIQGTVESLAETLFQTYLLPFELTSFLLLLGVFAAVALAKKEEE